MEDPAEFIVLNHLCSFGKNLSSLKKKIYLPAEGRSVWWKTVTSVLKMLPSACGLGQYFQDLDHSFSPNGPPGREITYISFFLEGTVKNPANWLVLYPASIFLSLPTGNNNAFVNHRVHPKFRCQFFINIYISFYRLGRIISNSRGTNSLNMNIVTTPTSTPHSNRV